MKNEMREMINNVKSYKPSIKTLTLYHGTCEENGKRLVENGWTPITGGSYGGNMGNPNYLYLSTEAEDALWFAEEKGCNTVIIVSNVSIDFLRPDPEDEAGFTMSELLDRISTSDSPAKFILIKPLDNTFFKEYIV